MPEVRKVDFLDDPNWRGLREVCHVAFCSFRFGSGDLLLCVGAYIVLYLCVGNTVLVMGPYFRGVGNPLTREYGLNLDLRFDDDFIMIEYIRKRAE